MTFTITLGWWMLPFALVPTLIVASTIYVNRSVGFGDAKGVLLVTAAFWLFMAAARWLP